MTGTVARDDAWLDDVAWNADGLVAAIAQEVGSNDVLMLAWMNREALAATLERGEAVYWSRSRAALWHKGDTSGHFQKVRDIRLDCDGDAILLKVEQVGGIACHTGRHSCFHRRLDGAGWVEEADHAAGEGSHRHRAANDAPQRAAASESRHDVDSGGVPDNAPPATGATDAERAADDPDSLVGVL